jgi:hypothetical protein
MRCLSVELSCCTSFFHWRFWGLYRKKTARRAHDGRFFVDYLASFNNHRNKVSAIVLRWALTCLSPA